jgi:carboxymethylenebutenolidase
MEITTQEVAIRCADGAAMKAFQARPAAPGKYPAIIVVHEAWGLNEQIRDVAKRYASEGYVTIAPHLFVRQGDLMTEKNIESAMKRMWSVPPEKRGDKETIEALMKTMTETERKVVNVFFLGRESIEKEMAGDLVSAAEFLKSQANVIPDKLGITGFCMGGGLTYQLSTMYPFKAAVPFYGANPKPLDAVAKISGSVLGIYAGEDMRINAEIPALVDAMVKHKRDYGMRLYVGTQHAFFNDTRPVYDRAAAADAWSIALSFFDKHLKQ